MTVWVHVNHLSKRRRNRYVCSFPTRGEQTTNATTTDKLHGRIHNAQSTLKSKRYYSSVWAITTKVKSQNSPSWVGSAVLPSNQNWQNRGKMVESWNKSMNICSWLKVWLAQPKQDEDKLVLKSGIWAVWKQCWIVFKNRKRVRKSTHQKKDRSTPWIKHWTNKSVHHLAQDAPGKQEHIAEHDLRSFGLESLLKQKLQITRRTSYCGVQEQQDKLLRRRKWTQIKSLKEMAVHHVSWIKISCQPWQQLLQSKEQQHNWLRTMLKAVLWFEEWCSANNIGEVRNQYEHYTAKLWDRDKYATKHFSVIRRGQKMRPLTILTCVWQRSHLKRGTLYAGVLAALRSISTKKYDGFADTQALKMFRTSKARAASQRHTEHGHLQITSILDTCLHTNVNELIHAHPPRETVWSRL